MVHHTLHSEKWDLCECALIRPLQRSPPHPRTHSFLSPFLKDPMLKKRRKGWDQETPTGEFKSISTNW